MKKLVLCFSLLVTSLAFSQNSNPNQNLNFNGTYLESEPVIDGNILGETLWSKVLPITDLKQIKPNYGAPASEKTEIRVAFTSKTIYVAVVCYDTTPENIVVSDSRRDADLNDDDSFLFILDTYNDQQNGFLFGTNANGMEYDAADGGVVVNLGERRSEIKTSLNDCHASVRSLTSIKCILQFE